eukprot:1665240-Rhodomonas_salina.2
MIRERSVGQRHMTPCEVNARVEQHATRPRASPTARMRVNADKVLRPYSLVHQPDNLDPYTST